MVKCPDCGGPMVGVEYSHDSPERYDGVSEYRCADDYCGIRIGRWSGRRLKGDEIEPRFGRGSS